MTPTEPMMPAHTGGMRNGGHLCIQTNEVRNFVVHYRRSADGALAEVEYQLYGNAANLIGYRTQPDGSLEEITRVAIPYHSSQGLAGF